MSHLLDDASTRELEGRAVFYQLFIIGSNSKRTGFGGWSASKESKCDIHHEEDGIGGREDYVQKSMHCRHRMIEFVKMIFAYRRGWIVSLIMLSRHKGDTVSGSELRVRIPDRGSLIFLKIVIE